MIKECVKEYISSCDTDNIEDYANLIDSIDEYLVILPDNADLLSLKNTIQDNYSEVLKTNSLNEAQSLYDGGDLVGAINTLKETLKTIDDSEVSTLLNTYLDEYENGIIEKINTFIDNEQYDEAIECLTEAQKVSDSSNITSLLSDVRQKQSDAIAAALIYNGVAVEFLDFSGSLSSGDDENNYSFTANQSGMYYLGLTNMTSGYELNVRVYSSDGSEIEGSSWLTNNTGLDCELVAGETYSVVVKTNNGSGDYTLMVGQQKPEVDISSYETVNDSMEYFYQCNNYLITPSVSGIYRFQFYDMKNGFQLRVHIYDSLGYEVEGSSYINNNNGVTAELNKDETYTVCIKQDDSLGSYVLSIGKPDVPEDISDKNIVSGEMRYFDQKNIYYYKPSSSGSYVFSFSNMREGQDIYFRILDSLGYTVGSGAY